MSLDFYQREILKFLSGDDTGGYWATRDVARHIPPFGHNAHTQSGATRSWLTELHTRGLVERDDTEKPTVWRITAKGRTALT